MVYDGKQGNIASLLESSVSVGDFEGRISFYEQLHIHKCVVLSVGSPTLRHTEHFPIHTLNASCIRGTRALPFFFRFFGVCFMLTERK